jgi:hypothetical protein
MLAREADEGRNIAGRNISAVILLPEVFLPRISAFGLLSSFGFRHSAFHM